MPAHTTVPPGLTALRAAGTSSPAAAKMIAASSGSGAGFNESPAQSAPRSKANRSAWTSPVRTKAYVRWPPWFRSEDDRRVERLRRGLQRVAGPIRAALQGESLGLDVAGPDEGIRALAAMA